MKFEIGSDMEMITNHVRRKLNMEESDTLTVLKDSGKTLILKAVIDDGEETLNVTVNRRKDGCRIISMG